MDEEELPLDKEEACVQNKQSENRTDPSTHLPALAWHNALSSHDEYDALVKKRLGHKPITSTQIYVQLLKGKGKEEYISKAATTLEEAKALIESGFEYVTDMQMGEMTYKLFRKTKPWQPS